VRFALAWRILTYDKGRTALAVVGVFMAILLVFVQLGFFIAVPQGGMLLYDRTRFDLLIASTGYEYQVQPGEFPLSQLDRARVEARPQGASANEVLAHVSHEFGLKVRPNHLGMALQRHRRAGRLELRDQRWYLPRSA
jgi:putative ABC transport system permease protein